MKLTPVMTSAINKILHSTTLTENNNSFTSINKHLFISNFQKLQFNRRTHGPIEALFFDFKCY